MEDTVLLCLRVYDEMRKAAADGRTMTCSELGERVGLSWTNPDCRATLCRLMDAVNLHMHHEGQPLLSAVVLTKENGKPWWGFFDRARSLGRYEGSDQAAFFQRELHRVFECYTVNDRS
jgi:hypothetical protein